MDGAGPMRFAFKIGYLPDGFEGFARQPGKVTVEGTLLSGLAKRKALPLGGSIEASSRTDKGVGAIGNVIAISSNSLSGAALGRILNAIDTRIICTSYAEVAEGFNPRYARKRWYRYVLPIRGRDLGRLRTISQLFIGEHEFASFSRRDGDEKKTRRSIDSIKISRSGDCFHIDIVARSFLWGQVRKIVAAMEQVHDGKLTGERVMAALEGRSTLTPPMSPPGGLVLMDVSYDFPFKRIVPRVPKRTSQFLDASILEAGLRATLLGWFKEVVVEGRPIPSAETGWSRSQDKPST